MKLNITQKIIENFIDIQPDPLKDENFNLWKSFFDFMKDGGDVDIEIEERTEKIGLFLNNLTTGRNGTKLTQVKKLPKPHNNSFPKKINSASIIFDNYNEDIPALLGKKNKLIFGNKSIYLSQWSKIIGTNFSSPLSFRKKKCDFNSWEFLTELVPFSSDIIFIDRYILSDKNLIPSNFLKILKNVKGNYEGTPNVLLVTDKKSSNITYDDLNCLIKEEGLGFNLSIVFSESNYWREHDRNIITNHIRLKSGDTFNFFNSAKELITKGTELDWYPLTTPSNVASTLTILSEIKEIISCDLNQDNKFGNFKNDLIL